MLSLLWAFGATLILFLILSLLRIGFSFKGKLIVALIGFVLALAGQAAVASFPLWQTGLILLLLVLAAAYVMDSRLASLIYNQGTDSFELETVEEYAGFTQKEEKQAELELLDLDTVGDELVPLMNIEDAKEPDLEEFLQDHLEPEDSLQEAIDLLLETDDLPNIVNSVREEIIEEEGYLADIETLLFEESEEISHFEEDDTLLEEIDDIEVFTDEKVEVEKDENLLEDLLRAVEEAAAGTEEEVVDLDKEREVKLQK